LHLIVFSLLKAQGTLTAKMKTLRPSEVSVITQLLTEDEFPSKACFMWRPCLFICDLLSALKLLDRCFKLRR